MRTPKCCVSGCNKKRTDAFLHHFPVSDKKRLNKWLDCINSEVLRSIPKQKLLKRVVCHVHFEKRFIRPNSRLRYGAYPSLFTSEEISSGVPSLPIEDIQNKYEQPTRKRHSDHTYCDDEGPSSKIARSTAASELLLTEDQPSTTVSSQSEKTQAASGPLLAVARPSTPVSSRLENTQGASGPLLAEARPSTTVSSRLENTQGAMGPLLAEARPSTTVSSRLENTQGPSGPLLAEARPSTPVSSRHENTQAPTFTIHKTPRPSRKRLVQKIKKLTPTCAKLYKEYNKAKQQADFQKRSKRALIFAKQNSFEEMTKNMNPFAKKIMQMQIKFCTKKKQARRFSDLEKVIGLAIMKQSPKCYRFLQQIFILPSKTTLNKLISQLNVDVGINHGLVEVMKQEVESWNSTKKFCSIVFDEMHLDEGLNFEQQKDCIIGFVHLNDKSKEFADQALVFMLRGAVYKWQQPFAFYFCKGTTKPAVLKNILKDIVAAAIEIGLSPVATICDQGSTFRKTLEELQQERRRQQLLANLPTDETVAFRGVNMHIIYDPPHLIKGFRNNVLNKTLEIDGKVSKWQDIVDVYLTDCNHAESRLLHKLNDEHVIPEKLKNKKMKVKAAVRVFSATVSAALSYTSKFSHYADGRPVSDTMANTAETVKFFDQLFDSMNGASIHHKNTKGKNLRKAVTSTSEHHSFWQDAIRKLEKIKFKDPKGNIVSVPTVKSCITTLKSYMKLWQFFKEQGVKVMRPRYFNSDPIENFFGQVRAYNFRHNDPNCHSFMYTFRSLLITRMIKFHSNNFNCEDDQARQLLTITQIFKLLPQTITQPPLSPTCQSRSVEPDRPDNVDQIINQARRERLEVHSRAYTAGWVVRKILTKTPCDECKKRLTTENQLPIHDWVSHREFNVAKKRLSYPSEAAVRCFGTVLKETNSYLEKSPDELNISKNIKELVTKKQDFSNVQCPIHQTGEFTLIVIRFTINNWCNIINKILRGSDVYRLENRTLPFMQEKALKKYQSKLKNKSFNKYFLVFFNMPII